MTLPENQTPPHPEHKDKPLSVSPWRRAAAGGALGIAGLLGVGTALAVHEAANDVPTLVHNADEAGTAAEQLNSTYEFFEHNLDKVSIEFDQEAGTVSATLPKNEDLTVQPFEKAFSVADKTEEDTGRVKWLVIGTAASVVAAAALWQRNKSEGQNNKRREAFVNMSREHLLGFSLLMASTGAAAGILGNYVTKPDVEKIAQFDMQEAFKLSDEMREDVEKLNIRVTQADESTTITFNPDEEALTSIRQHAVKLEEITPDVTHMDVLEAEIVGSFAALSLFGFVTTLGGTASALARTPGYYRQGRHTAKQKLTRPRREPDRVRQERAAARLTEFM